LNSDIRYRFGDKLRDIRERRGQTLKNVAEKAGLSESLISQIERNKVSPSIDTLFSIADVLEIGPEYLFSDLRREKKVNLVASDERRIVVTRGVKYSQLSIMHDDRDEHAIEAFIMEIDPGCGMGSRDYGHIGREMGYILKGQGELEYGSEKYDLSKGDSIAFSSDSPHLLKNSGRGVLEALWIITPPKGEFFNS